MFAPMRSSTPSKPIRVGLTLTPCTRQLGAGEQRRRNDERSSRREVPRDVEAPSAEPLDGTHSDAPAATDGDSDRREQALRVVASGRRLLDDRRAVLRGAAPPAAALDLTWALAIGSGYGIACSGGTRNDVAGNRPPSRTCTHAE